MGTKRYHSIDIIKGIAMIMIILCHYGQNYQIEFVKSFVYLQMGCPIFFVVSGYGIKCLVDNKYNGKLTKKNIKEFYISRLKALTPGWYICFVCVILCNSLALYFTGKTFSFGRDRRIISILCNLLYLNGLLPFCNNSVMPGGWYIGTTVVLYALTPLILYCIRRVTNKSVFLVVSSAIGIVIWGILYFVFPSYFSSSFGYHFFLIHYPEYALGIIIGCNRTKISRNISNKLRIVLLLCIALILAVSMIVFNMCFSPFNLIIAAWTIALSTCFALLLLIPADDEVGKMYLSVVLGKLGKNCYFIYLVHGFIVWPFVRVALVLLNRLNIPIILSFWILIPITIALAYYAGLLLRMVVGMVNNMLFAPK